ncbi:MAG TPA: putative Ig domain-containing protein, partial [Candidatus Acidoferrum sp.]|nr:putative Ig domain-containing protein [Candidatus Acidoferrum sp.]
SIMSFGPFSATDVVSCTGQTIPLPPGNYSRVQLLAAGVNGNQSPGSFGVNYSDSTETLLIQSFSDWFTPANNSGESKVAIMSYRNINNGTEDNRTFYLYGYSFKLNSSKIVSSIRLPSDANIIVTAINLVPNWPPTFGVNPLTLPGATSGQAYSTSITTNASDLNGDSLTFAKISGPSWLNVASNGALFGTPASTNANTNTFMITVTDTGGLSSTDTVYISVTNGPYFNVNPFTMPSVMAGQNFANTVATNVTEPNAGDTPTFSLVSGPGWLSMDTNGVLSGEPLSPNVGTNTFVVSATDQTGLSNIATMYVPVTAAPPILPEISQQAGSLMLNWSGGIAPYQVQMATNLLNPNWQDVGGTVSGTNLVVTPSNSAAFYRIIGN